MNKYKVTISKYSTKRWWLNGLIHREGGPAVELSYGTKQWRFNGVLHREGGPALEYANGTEEWWFEGVYYSSAEYSKRRLLWLEVNTKS